MVNNMQEESLRKKIKELEEQLSEKQIQLNQHKKFASFLQNQQDLIIQFDANLQVLFVNQMFCTTMGVSQDEIVGSFLLNIIDSPKRKHFKFLVEQLKQPPYFVKHTFLSETINGKRWIEWSATAINNDKGEIESIINTGRDITEQKQTEHALKKSEEKYRTIIQESPVGILYYDEKGVITDCNPRFVDIIGSSKEVLIGLDMINQLNDNKLISAVKKSLSEGQSTYEDWYKSVTSDKCTFVHIIFKAIRNEKQEIIAGVGLVEDITNRRKAENIIAESEERYRTLFNSSNMLISVVDREGICQLANEKVAGVFGTKKENLIGLSFKDKHGKYGTEYIQRIKFCIDEDVSKDYVDEVEFPTGTRWMYSRIHPIDYGKGKPKHAQVISYDITEQKKAEQALVKSEKRFQEIFESVKEGIIYVDLNGTVLYVNKAMADITGIPVKEIVNKNAYHLAKKFVSVRDLPGLLKKLTQALQGKTLEPFELRYKDKILELSSNYTKNSRQVTSSIRDITPQKRAQQQLIESEKKYRNLFENAPVGIFQTNSKGQVLLVNIEMARMLGFKTTREAMDFYYDLGKQLYTDPRRRKEFIQILQKHGEVEDFEFEAKHKSGKIIWLNMNARLVKKLKDQSFIIEGFTSNITKRKLAENALKEQKILFETMFHSITDGIVITNTKREILLANKGIEKTFGYKTNQIIGKCTDMLYANEHEFDKTGEEIFNNHANSQEEFFITQYRHKNNTIFPGETFGAKLFDANGSWIGNLGIIRDISERQSFIHQLEVAKEKAEESDRLKSSFLANMSHEIRTPMNGILGFSRMLLTRKLNVQKQEQYAQIIIDNSKQLLTIVNDILDISMIEAGQLKLLIKSVNINELIDQLHIFYRPQAKKRGVQLKTSKALEEHESIIQTDHMRLRQVLNNLINNAVKFTEQGHIEFGYEREANYLRFFVKDTGIGIAPDLLQEMFERFRQEELEDSRKMGGNGLGLAISKKLVEMLGGQIGVNSVKGEGSEFYFTIPYKPH